MDYKKTNAPSNTVTRDMMVINSSRMVAALVFCPLPK